MEQLLQLVAFKIAHGGLRYLQHLNFQRLYESVEEQRLLRVLAPHLIHPLPFLVPCYGNGSRARWLLRAALTTYEALTARRNKEVSPSHVLPGHRILSPAEVLAIAPCCFDRGVNWWGRFLRLPNEQLRSPNFSSSCSLRCLLGRKYLIIR